MSAPLCPHCGYDLIVDQPIIINDWAMMSPVTPLRYRGHPITLTGSERNIVWTVMKMCPQPVAFDVILERLGSESTGNLIDVYMSRMRKKFAAADMPMPIAAARLSVGRRSLYWKMDVIT